MTHTARIVAITQPRIADQTEMTAAQFVAYAARVSNPANQANTLTATRLLRYLIEHRHWSPFEMISVTMEITTTRDIGRQIIRHRSFSFQEFSQRFATVEEPAVWREARMQAASNRQSSTTTDDTNVISAWHTIQARVAHDAKAAYDDALALGIAREQARSLLPEGLTATRMYMAGTLRSWIHYIDVRITADTQHEHRLVALDAQREILSVVPELSAYWK